MKRRVRSLALAVAGALALSGFAAATASAAATATTVTAAGITQTSATLYGVVETGGSATEWEFEYGTSTAYGSTTTVQSIPAGQGNVPVSAHVTGLKPGTTYHFQLLALNSSGPPYYTISPSAGGDQTFKTLAATPGILTLRNSNPVVGKNNKTVLFLKCLSTSAKTNACDGGLRITTKVKTRKVTATVPCGKASFAVNPRQTKQVTVKVSSACLKLLRAARGHRLGATLKASWSGGKLTRGITLVLK